MKIDDYLNVLKHVSTEIIGGETDAYCEEINAILTELILNEKEYEFNEERPRIQSLLDSIIR